MSRIPPIQIDCGCGRYCHYSYAEWLACWKRHCRRPFGHQESHSWEPTEISANTNAPAITLAVALAFLESRTVD
jgi:hypothetical protein